MISHLITVFQQQGFLLSDQEINAFSETQSVLHDEDIVDALWLASKINDAYAINQTNEPDQTDELASDSEAIPIQVIDDGTVAGEAQPFVSAYMPQPNKPSSSSVETPEQGLPIQIQAAPALSDPREIGRSLRPLMRKVASSRRSELDELATANRIAERDIWMPILKPAPERWFDLELVIEASKFSFIWQDTLDEFQHLLEYQGAFRNVRAWYVQEGDAGQPQLIVKKQQLLGTERDVPIRSHKELLDTSGRRLVLFVSDCRSRLWHQGQIHGWLATWSQSGPTAIVQLLPERLWNESELDVGFAGQVSSLMPGAPNSKLQIRGLSSRTEITATAMLTLPVVTLTTGALKQWALVVSAAGNQRCPARLFDLAWVKNSERDRSRTIIRPKSAEERLELFMATASPLAQRLARMMAAVPIELPVVHLIQQELLHEVQPIHIAEVYTSSLLEANQPKESGSNAPVRYEFVKGVRELLNERTPVDETVGVLEALSRRIARTLGFEIKSFTALLSPKSTWNQELKDAVLPFAQVATEVLHRLGGDYAELARLVEQNARRHSDWIQPLEFDPLFSDLKVLEFTTAQLVEADAEPSFPALQTEEVEIVTIVVEGEPENTPFDSNVQFIEFQVATVEPRSEAPQPSFLDGIVRRGGQRSEWVVRKQQQQNGQWVEELGNRVRLQMVVIPSGSFMMGSPNDETERRANEDPQHRVEVQAFLMGQYPVTQAQWKLVANLPQVNRKLSPSPSHFRGSRSPVEQVSWYDAVEFCARLAVHTDREYRLPTEAEWEYACRARTTTPFHFGKMITTDVANYNGEYAYNNGPTGENRRKTTPISHFGVANVFGLSDMHGNVWEWCIDHWHDSYEGAPTDGSAWLSDNENNYRLLRGGSWNYNPENCRSAFRFIYPPDLTAFNLGFRVVCSAPRTL
ncbi:formylglycine-generating enzyme family protein [Trichocoleus desertorum AS-A10]|uniref:formylglycine-generating enzyme family protein n=1 Tax=Trichocoleus desertorum TaxID=1481672 RepID=UPI00329A74B5